MINVVVICSTFSSIVLIVYLLNVGKIGSVAFTTLFIAILLVSLALYGFDRLRELDIRNFKLILDEAKQIRKDIYAKTETVKNIGEELADLAFSVTSVGRFSGPDLQKQMLESRDKITTVLKEIGSDNDKITKISSQIDDRVLLDYKNDALQEIRFAMGNLKLQSEVSIEAIINRFKDLFKNYDRKRIEDYLKEQGLSSERMLPLLDKIDSFLKTKTIN